MKQVTRRGSQLPILNYHGIESKAEEYLWVEGEKPYVVTLDHFWEQLDHLVKNEFSSLTLGRLDRWFDGRSNGHSIIITFDDGHLSHFEHAVPSLKKAGLKGLFFIPVGLVGHREQMTWSHLKQLLIEGFEVGSHGYRHIPLTNLKRPELLEELERSKKTLEDRLGVAVTSFSIPRGFYRPRIGQTASEVGYRFVFTSQFDLNVRSGDPMCLSRLVVKSNLSLRQFSRMIRGELGFKKRLEGCKDVARRLLSPSVYDALVNFKRAVRTES